MRKLTLLVVVFLIVCQTTFASQSDSRIRIAIIDTGISTEALGNEQVIQGNNYILPGDDTEDRINHGTAIASLIVGKLDRGLVGADPEALLVPLVYYSIVDNSLVKGDATMLAQSIYDAVDIFSARVINLSAGVLADSKALKEACAYAEEKGVVVVSAVGNDYLEAPGNLYYPAAYETVIGVGALNEKGSVARFSQKNTSVALVAEGENLWVARASGKMTYVSGTSYASALVSGAVARLLAQNPELSPSDVRSILYKSAIDLGPLGYDLESGYGAVNIQEALTLSKDYRWFYDVSSHSWYYNAIKRMHLHGLIQGTSESMFSPNVTTTQAMVLTMLYRLAGEPNPLENHKNWYASAAAWASTYNIFESDALEAPISRESLATILWRFAAYSGNDVTLYETTDISNYDDFSIISKDAVLAMQWAVGYGVMQGNTDKTLNPKGQVTRAEVAMMIFNYLK